MPARTKSSDTMKMPCDVCGGSYDAGPHRYTFHKLKGYDICVCETCYASNWDGWGPIIEPRILQILADKGKQVPKRNAKGWLPREF